MSKWMSDEEIAELKKERPLTGNGFIDAYQLGFDAGCASRQHEIDETQNRNSELNLAKYKAEMRVKELEEENERLRKKLVKFKKRCKAMEERGER